MRRLVMVLGVAALAAGTLNGCNKPGYASPPPAHGRYVGVGIYSPAKTWENLVRADATQDAAAATLADDDEIIVVVDSITGELRQCGNLSGHCIAMNPWTSPAGAGQGAPARLLKHARELSFQTEPSSDAAPEAPTRTP